MNSEIVFYEGLKGSGVVASITYNHSRVIFDFGAPFNPMTQPYDGQVEKRVKSWVTDAIRLGQIPPIEGVFSERDLASRCDIIPYEKCNLTTGIIISHLHLDHMSGIGMVHPDIPVYLHQDAYRLQNALDAIGESVGTRSFSPVSLYEPFNIGEIQVTALFSDHPCMGSVGYLIEPPDGKYYYSGDVRMHGSRLSQVIEDLEKISDKNVDVLILEMTTLSPTMYDKESEELLIPTLEIPQGMTTEEQLLGRLLAELKTSRNLAVFNIYHRDLELIKGLFEVARRSNREIVFEPKTAYIIYRIIGKIPTIFIPDCKEYENRSAGYLSEILSSSSRVVTYQEIQSHPEKYFLQNSYEHILELFDLPMIDSTYYHLYGIPLVEGSKDYVNMQRVLNIVGCRYSDFANLYCYNHAYPNNLLFMANKIKAKNLVGVHSSNPENMVYEYGKQIYPQKGKSYRLQKGELVLKK